MQSELIRGVTVRPLRNGETEVVQAVFDRLGTRSRWLRFDGAKNVLSQGDLAELSQVDDRHHVLVALLDGEPVGIARLVRERVDPSSAEVAIEVVDAMQCRGIGKVLAERLAADARAAGIERLNATVHSDNRASLALMRRVTDGLRARCSAGRVEVTGRPA